MKNNNTVKRENKNEHSTKKTLVETSTNGVKKEKLVAGTGEWASQNANFINGCAHDCKYCYAKSMAVRFKRKTVDSWKIEEVNSARLQTKLKKKDGYTMFPSSHDISPENLSYSLEFMKRLLENGHHILVVTKPHLSVIESICESFDCYKDKILFRFTIGSSDSETLNFWEPYAPSFEERLASLKHAHLLGFHTSVSCEPALDINTLKLVNILLPYVTDAIWIGLPNRLKGILKVNGATDFATSVRAEELIAGQSLEWVKDLYGKLKRNPRVKWKDSIKKIVNIERSTRKGLDA
ncbi:radical SAM domain protein [Aquipluma nitroreducens]|uniref:Radical SAM domain protein n=1 Tax=Aquipluma nitroreducens TaxID=2010828 RepID=A0A5K7S7W8_9BACT|nr:radical SAM protein [Aquipluma nitroreducens]BBE17585.1 radical SAM domain protein [Aquipluma nitroreducens]